MEPETDTRETGQRIEQVLGELSAHQSVGVAEAAQELAELLMGMYGAGLARVVELLDGTEALQRIAQDELVGGLLVLHDLHPDDTATRAARALESVRPYLGSHAGDVELLGVDWDNTAEPGGAVVRLALTGSCDGCPSSSITVTTAIGTAIQEACPEVIRVHVDGVTEPAGPSASAASSARGELPLLQIQSGPPTEEVPVAWVVLEPPELRPGQCATVDVAGHPVLLAQPAGSPGSGGLVAYRDSCPACHSELDGAVLTGDLLFCPGCQAGFDVRRAGRAVAGTLHLEPLPVVTRAGGLRLAIPRATVGVAS